MALGPDNLLIVGAGVLGRDIARLWKAAHPGANVVGETRSDSSHETLADLGVIPALVGQGEEAGGAEDGEKFSHVVFCAPPSGSKDYPADVGAAAARAASDGVFVFTSSGGIYRDTSGVLTEDSPISEATERTKRLALAERASLGIPQGRVLRLAGLYNLNRGLHSYAARIGKPIPGQSESRVNQIHYEDAASLVCAILGRPDVERRVFLGCDAENMTRGDIMRSAMAHPSFADFTFFGFEESGPVVTKSYDNTATQRALDWEPKYKTFAAFMSESGAVSAA